MVQKGLKKTHHTDKLRTAVLKPPPASLCDIHQGGCKPFVKSFKGHLNRFMISIKGVQNLCLVFFSHECMANNRFFDLYLLQII